MDYNKSIQLTSSSSYITIILVMQTNHNSYRNIKKHISAYTEVSVCVDNTYTGTKNCAFTYSGTRFAGFWFTIYVFSIWTCCFHLWICKQLHWSKTQVQGHIFINPKFLMGIYNDSQSMKRQSKRLFQIL